MLVRREALTELVRINHKLKAEIKRLRQENVHLTAELAATKSWRCKEADGVGCQGEDR